MNAKRAAVITLAVLMLATCFVSVASADGTADKFAPINEESIQLYDGIQGPAYGMFSIDQSFGALITVPEGKRLTRINFHSLAMYADNSNRIVFRAYQWDTDYITTVMGQVLAQTTVVNHIENDPLDVSFPTNRNLTGKILWTATYVDGAKGMTPWAVDGNGVEGVKYFSNGKEDGAFCFGATFADELTVIPATYTATFMAEGIKVYQERFFEGDTELFNIPIVPEKEGFRADWEAYTLGNADITINAVYTDASGAIKPEIPDATKMTAFSEDHASYLRGEGCTSKVNRDGSVSFIGNWVLDGDIDAYATINYLQLMMKYYDGYNTQDSLPNRSHRYNVVAVKVVAPPVALESTPNMTVIVGRNIEIYGIEVANEIKCNNSVEYWIFDFSEEADFTSDPINSMKINWAYAYGEEDNLGAEFKILGFQFFDTLDEAMTLLENQKTDETTGETTGETTDETTDETIREPIEEMTTEIIEETTTPYDDFETLEETTVSDRYEETNIFGDPVEPETREETTASDRYEETNIFGDPVESETKKEADSIRIEFITEKDHSHDDGDDEYEDLDLGCGAVVGFGAVAVLAAAAAAVVLKKKD